MSLKEPALMAKNIFQQDLERSNRKAGMTAGLIAAAAFFLLVFAWMTYTMFRIDVDRKSVV